MSEQSLNLTLPGQHVHGSAIQHVLYITYDGILEPIGYSQVIQYLKKLAPGRKIFLVSFEKPAEWANLGHRRRMQAELQQANIQWTALRYHKTPSIPATAYDLLVGMLVASYLVVRHRIAIVHARSYVPAVLALALKRMLGTRFIFDMRGWWADERVEGNLWTRESKAYLAAKWFERKFLLRADSVVSLTANGVREMERLDYLRGRRVDFHVIPTCADLDRFQPRSEANGAGFTIGYVGTVGLWNLIDPAIECFGLALQMRPDARVLIINRGEHPVIRACLRRCGLPDDRVELIAVEARQMPECIARIDAAVFFVKPAYAKRWSAPTRLGELLGAGIPCLTNAGVGDIDRILAYEKAGIAVSNCDADSLKDGVDRLLKLAATPGIRQRCRAAAVRTFSLDAGVRAYSKIYDSLSGGA